DERTWCARKDCKSHSAALKSPLTRSRPLTLGVMDTSSSRSHSQAQVRFNQWRQIGAVRGNRAGGQTWARSCVPVEKWLGSSRNKEGAMIPPGCEGDDGSSMDIGAVGGNLSSHGMPPRCGLRHMRLHAPVQAKTGVGMMGMAREGRSFWP